MRRPPIALSHGGHFFAPAWSEHGRGVVFSRNNPDSSDVSLISRDIRSGDELELLRRPSLSGAYVAPDGRIAIGASDPSTAPVAIVLVQPDGGGSRELLRVAPPERVSILGWQPDGGALLVRRFTGAGTSSRLWAVPVDGEPPRKLELNVDAITPGSPIRLHPDGSRVAFMEGAGKHEVWAIDDLPAVLKAHR